MPRRPITCALGLDPSFRNFGYVVYQPTTHRIVTSGVLITKGTPAKKRTIQKSAEDMGCLMQLWSQVTELVEEHVPAVICAEIPSAGAKSASAIKSLAYATALTAALAAHTSLPLLQFSPGDLKMHVGGSLKTTKPEIQAAMFSKYNFPELPKRKPLHEHIADAAATLSAAESDPVWKALF